MDGYVCLESACGFKVSDALHRKWDAPLAFLSWMLATVGAFTTLRIVANIRYCADAFWYWAFVISAGLSFGGLTVWDMHQVGMEALKLVATREDGLEAHMDIKYGLSFSIISGFAAWFVGCIGIWIVTGRSLQQRNMRDRSLYVRLITSAMFVALGICAMHYMGMLSMTGQFVMEWKVGIMCISFIIAFSAAFAGLTILMVFPAKVVMQVFAAAIIGLAVCGMHYTGMYAVSYYISEAEESITGEEGHHVSGIVVTICALLANIFLAIPLHHYSEEQRSNFERRMYEELAQKKREEQYAIEQRRIIDLSTAIAQAMVNYDLIGATELCKQSRGNEPTMQPMKLLLQNLTVYRAFLPHALFDTSKSLGQVPNQTLASALDGAEVSVKDVELAVSRLRDPTYSLHDFHFHMVRAFPELQLYNIGDGKSITSGHDGAEEYQRTLGALYTLFAVLRLDIDGKDIMTFGVDTCGQPRAKPLEDDAGGAKKQSFYQTMDGPGLTELCVRAGLLTSGSMELVKNRVVAMLALTAIHDIMKNRLLLPTVQKAHAPYHGCEAGDEVAVMHLSHFGSSA